MRPGGRESEIMRFLLRAAFWLMVMWAVLPHGNGAGLQLGNAAAEAAGRGAAAAGAALGTWCAGAPSKCFALARSGPTSAAPSDTTMLPQRASAAVPLPEARPPALDRRG